MTTKKVCLMFLIISLILVTISCDSGATEPKIQDVTIGIEYIFNLKYTSDYTAIIDSIKLEYINRINGELVIPATITSEYTAYDITITEIGSSAFSGCTGLTSITIPDSVTSIGNGAFYGCTGLTSITIPDSVTTIGSFAFGHCTGLTSITVPDSVTEWGETVFYYCEQLKEIPQAYINSLGGDIEDEFYYCKALTMAIVLPDTVTNIGEKSFYNCKNITSITIPDSVTGIEIEAFYNCKSLTSVTIPSSVSNIGSWAFYDCSSLATINYSGTISQWNEVQLGSLWHSGHNYPIPATAVHCSDGDVPF